MLFEVDFNDFGACLDLMKQYGDSELPFFGSNQEGEKVLISVNPDNIAVRTFQNNGWMRINTLWDDGTTEETYER